MPEPANLLHPRKLYEQLRACPSAHERAQVALDFLRSCTGSEGGFLLLSRGDALVVASSTHSAEAPAGLLQEAQASWERELEAPSDNTSTNTVEFSALQAATSAEQAPIWKSPSGVRFERRLLSMYNAGRFIPVGLVFLKLDHDHALAPMRHAHVEALCSALIDAGDVPDTAP